MLHVRRTAASLGAFILLVPLIGLLGPRCTQAPCCSPGFCPLPAGHTHHPATSEQRADDHAATPASCVLNAGCSQMNQDGALAPLPRVVLDAAMQLPAPELARWQIVSLTQITPPGFYSVPSPPPRWNARAEALTP